MKDFCGVEIEEIERGGMAKKAGILRGDRLIAINGNRIRDVIDLMFFGNESPMNLTVKRDKQRMSFNIDLSDGKMQGLKGDLGIITKPFKIRTCRNNCIFCFVSQLPKGMRKTLYIKDEDYKMSFLYGNYITLTNLSDEDKRRIVEQRLSPLYISVHSTDREIRNKMLGNQKASDILMELKFLSANKIRMHTQIVLCPGYNDGRNLEKTILDLYALFPYVMSIAVVPVGLTEHRKRKLRPVDKESARDCLNIIHRFQRRFKRKHGENIVYGADELYIRAESDFPALKDYGDLPQIENGVGMVSSFMHKAKGIKVSSGLQKGGEQKRRFITFTGMSFHPYLRKFLERFKNAGIDIEAAPVENTFFGRSVTVTGLLTGRDVIKTLSDMVRKDDILLIPDVVMRDGDEVLLDGVSMKDLEEMLDVKTMVIESSPEGILNAVADHIYPK